MGKPFVDRLDVQCDDCEEDECEYAADRMGLNEVQHVLCLFAVEGGQTLAGSSRRGCTLTPRVGASVTAF